MKVWDLANEREREQLRLIILKKFSTSKTLGPDEKLVYWRAFRGGGNEMEDFWLSRPVLLRHQFAAEECMIDWKHATMELVRANERIEFP